MPDASPPRCGEWRIQKYVIVVLPIVPYFLAVLNAAALIMDIGGSGVVDTSSSGKYCAATFPSGTVASQRSTWTDPLPGR